MVRMIFSGRKIRFQRREFTKYTYYRYVTPSGGMWPESPSVRKMTRPFGVILNHVILA